MPTERMARYDYLESGYIVSRAMAIARSTVCGPGFDERTITVAFVFGSGGQETRIPTVPSNSVLAIQPASAR